MKKLFVGRKRMIVLAIATLTVCVGIYWVTTNGKDMPELPSEQETTVEEQKTEEIITIKPAETTPAVVEKKITPPPVAEPSPEWPVILTNTEATSLTVVINKKHKLPSDYVPELTDVTGGKMRPEAAQALTSLLYKADEAGVSMSVLSSYRSYSTQVSTYNKWVSQSGKAVADTFSARPGHSEHQLGLAADLGNGTCNLETCFGNTAAGKWLANIAQDYGFIIRYPAGSDGATGYQYEPWHLRYVGVETAKAIVASGQTMDQYYGIPAGDYQ